ncbi:MAG: adenylate/guanylate cyclase domain-containing protein, partial [Acidimicrobiia bacterium]|nr:adenylate/guanylate cyclase domain-containing protein [Acidimicrobiia bacterium]
SLLALRSYWRLRNRPPPERVSPRRIRAIEAQFAVSGAAWGLATFLVMGQYSRSDSLVVFIAMGTFSYATAGTFGTVPRGTAVLSVLVYLGIFGGVLVNDVLSPGVLLLIGIGQVAGVVLTIRWNWLTAIRSLQLHSVVETQRETLAGVAEQLGKYISPQLYERIFRGEQRVEIRSTRKKLTVFFSDVVSFTEITDQLESEELTALLNHYLGEMSLIAEQHGATFDKFIGDAIVLYFGDPDTRGVTEDAEACVRMAIDMQRRVRQLQGEWRDRGVERPFEIRIGINTGYCTVGNFGSPERMNYTIIGSEVNLASRLESAADVGGILLSHETYSLVKDWVMAEEAQAITVKGFARPVTTYRVLGIYDDLERQGRVIHRAHSGFSVTVDKARLSEDDRAAAIRSLEEVVGELSEQDPGAAGSSA